MAKRNADKYASRHCWLKYEGPCGLSEVFVCLSRAPLTLGHSQLIVEAKRDVSDDQMFHWAVLGLTAAIKTFECELDGVLNDDNSTWADLARWTETSGRYLKTLILRSSASEEPDNPDEESLLKVHLVPYFKSHEDACYDRFHDRHTVPPHQRGGLLGWLGVREDKVDKLEVDWPCENHKDKCAKDLFRLDKLAETLSKAAKRHLNQLKKLDKPVDTTDDSRKASKPKRNK